VRAHLGDHGHTFVPTKPGITVREALGKAMKLRKLAPETCKVYKVNDKVRTSDYYILTFETYFRHPNLFMSILLLNTQRRSKFVPSFVIEVIFRTLKEI
jgi:hypothetical protein